MQTDNIINMTERGLGRKLRVAVGPPGSTNAGRGTNKVKNKLMGWDELVSTLDKPIVTHETVAEYAKMGKEAQLAVKDQGYFLGGHCKDGIRKKTHMLERDLLAIDGDFATDDWREKLFDALVGFSWCAHTTHKHTPTKPRYRLIMPLSRPVNQFEYAFLCRHVAAMIHMETFDPAGHRWVQAMFWPSAPKDGEYDRQYETGTWLDPDECMAEYPDWRDVDQWPGADREAASLRHSMQKAGNPLEKPGIVGAFCRAYPDIYSAMDLIPEAYESTGQENRFSYSDGQSKNGAIVYDDLWLYSHHGSDPCGGMLVNAFDMVRLHRFGDLDGSVSPDTAITKLPSYKAMAEFAMQTPDVAKEMVKAKIQDDASQDFEAIVRDDDDTDWLSQLAISEDGRIKSTLLNASLLLVKDSQTKGRIYYDDFGGGIKAADTLPEFSRAKSFFPAEWQDEMDLALRCYMERKYKVAFAGQTMADAVSHAAGQAPRHAVRDWLNTLTWDGNPRVEGLWTDYLRTPSTPYYTETARAFLVGAVQRVFEPGSKMDYVPIIEGGQGLRKSTFWEVLANGYFTELHTFDQKAAAEILQGVWIAEVPELDPFNKHEIEAIKAFFTAKSPRFRGAFRRHAGTSHRQCVFGGTTNKRSGYLRDPTGNRRFWPIGYVDHTIDTDHLASQLGQIWAEAVTLYKSGAQPTISKEAEALARIEQQKREQVDEWTGLIHEWLDKPTSAARYSDSTDDFDQTAPTGERDRACIPEIWTDCLGKTMDSLKPWDRSRIKAAVEATGVWRVTESSRRFGRFGRQKLIEKV